MDSKTSELTQAFTEQEREAVYRAILERRDVRKFRPGQISDEIIHRILNAAVHAPSVGYMQPWNFILIQDLEIRHQVYAFFLQANKEAKEMFDGKRKKQYATLKLEGILDSSLNICVTCDRNRFGPVVLGRTCQPDMDLYSTVCAVQNLWLAARSEGIAVGWVSILKPEDLKEILNLPHDVVPIAYLCVGYTDSFASEPELKTVGWLPEVPLKEFIFYEKWGNSLKALSVSSEEPF